jgi:hypothetical protein
MSTDTTPSVSDLLNNGGTPPDGMTAEQGRARLVELRRSQSFLDQYRRGDPQAVQQMDQVAKALIKGDSVVAGRGVDPAKLGHAAADAAQVRTGLQWDQVMDSMRTSSDFPEDLEAALRAQQPLTAQQRRWAEQQKAQAMNDKGFLRRLEDGDRKAKMDWNIINSWLSLPVLRS